MNSPKGILEAALKLLPAERFLVIQGLINSLDQPDKTIDEVWAIEAEKRLQAYKDGHLKTLTYEEVFGEKKAQ